jgi:hypothetical protein
MKTNVEVVSKSCQFISNNSCTHRFVILLPRRVAETHKYFAETPCGPKTHYSSQKPIAHAHNAVVDTRTHNAPAHAHAHSRFHRHTQYCH